MRRAEFVEMQREARQLVAEVEQTDAKLEAEAERERQERMLAAAEATARHLQPKLCRSAMNVRQKSAFIAKHDMETFLALPWT